jgi:ParB-like chromosome segregation protein Spo0J
MAKTRGLHISKIALEFGLSQKQLGRYESLLSFSKALQELVDAGELSMEHARQLHAHRMSDVAAWTKRIQDEQLSVLDLRRQLRADSGRRTTGHRRHLIKRDGRLLRVFPFRIHKDAPRVELLAIIKSFRDAIAFLEDDSGDREHGPRNQ